jgi:hypothetical protein
MTLSATRTIRKTNPKINHRKNDRLRSLANIPITSANPSHLAMGFQSSALSFFFASGLGSSMAAGVLAIDLSTGASAQKRNYIHRIKMILLFLCQAPPLMDHKEQKGVRLNLFSVMPLIRAG